LEQAGTRKNMWVNGIMYFRQSGPKPLTPICRGGDSR
jgi:hypothetical protein